MSNRTKTQTLATLAALPAALTLALACGKARPYDQGEDLGSATLGGGGGGRVVSGQQTTTSPSIPSTTVTVTKKKTILVTKKRLKPRPTFNIVRVQKIVPAANAKDDWATSALPFYYANFATQPPRDMEPYPTPGVPATQPPRDRQWPVKFDFAYPTNNFHFKEAKLIVDTQRDNSDTEGIYIDGVFSGRPPDGQLVNITTRIPDPAYRIYVSTDLGGGASSGTGANRLYIEDSLKNYRRDEVNSFYLDVARLVDTSPMTSFSVVNDGHVDVVLGDDSPIYKAFLVVKGDTISSADLQCRTSDVFTFRNHLVHHDGNSIGESAFTGNVGFPHQSWANPAGYDATELFFNVQLPDAKAEDINLTSATLRLHKVKFNGAGGACATVVVNGVGVSDPTCDRSKAVPEVVESWDENAAATAAWSTFKSQLSNAGTTAALLDLVGLFGAAKVKELLKQGKLNVALANGLATKSETTAGGNALTASAARTFGTGVDGPELIFAGNYTIQDCDVPNDPDSPMTENGFVEPPYVPEYEEYTVEVEVEVDETTTVDGSAGEEEVTNDGAGPVLASIQVQDITNNSAVIYWSTDEPSTSQVLYGIIGQATNATAEDASLVTFHKVTLTGLAPFKYYNFQVVSKDKYGNPSTSSVAVFTTLR